MSGFEIVPEGHVTDVNQSGTQTAADAIVGFLDQGPEQNPGQGESHVEEKPAEGETVEQLGPDDNRGEPQYFEEQQGAEEHGQGPDHGDEGQDERELYTVTVQGEAREVSLEDLQSGYMLQADYTKKTQGLADERRALTSEFEQVRQERQQYVNLLTSLEQQLQTGGEQEPDWVALSRTDPVGYTRQKAAWDEKQNVINAAKIERERVEQLQQQDAMTQAREFAASQQQAMLRVKPELADPEKAAEYRASLVNYAGQAYGYTEQEMGMINDHRHALILEKAMKYDEAVKAGGIVQGKLKNKSRQPVMRPGARQGPEVVRDRRSRQAQDRFESSGDVRDAARLMENFVD